MNRTEPKIGLLCALCALCGWFSVSSATAAGSDLDEFKVKREAVFEFAERPRVTREGDRVTIRFASKGFCDATVAIEDEAGRIVRHLVSGVLGPRAPAPFQRDSKAQTLVWDGKDDQGRYIDDKDRLTVRVSLGLKPQFERTLFWSPHKRIATPPPVLAAAEEGVYVAEGRGVDHVRLYDHGGNYLRTIYPFPADKLAKVDQLAWQTMPQDGLRAPVKQGFYRSTLLTCGKNASTNRNYISDPMEGIGGMAVTAMAARGGRVAVAYLTVNRLSSDGSSGGLPFEGPSCLVPIPVRRWVPTDRATFDAGPRSAAFSPDGKWLYLTGYAANHSQGNVTRGRSLDWLHGVLRLAYEKNDPPEVFLGSKVPGRGSAGGGDDQLCVPTSVACDRRGRVYVADYMNDRIQVFSADGTYLNSIPAAKPAQVAVHQLNDELYVFSWALSNQNVTDRHVEEVVEPTLTVLGPPEDPRVRWRYPLPLTEPLLKIAAPSPAGGLESRVELDSWADPPVIWIVPARMTWFDFGRGFHAEYERSQIRLLVQKDGKLVVKRDFAQAARQAVVKLEPPDRGTGNRQRLYANPKTGDLFVGEGSPSLRYSFTHLVQVNPATGRIHLVELPFDSEDLAFDEDGLAYLRTDLEVARYDPAGWREIPFDYGESRPKVGFAARRGRRGKFGSVTSAIPLPGSGTAHIGGLAVAPNGHLAVQFTTWAAEEKNPKETLLEQAKTYRPRVYPGRVIQGAGSVIHVFDQHGKPLYEDAIQGLDQIRGLGIDRQDALYVISTGTRMLDGKPFFDQSTCTLMRFQSGSGRIVSSVGHPVPLPAGDRPARAPDLLLTDGSGGVPSWAEKADWFYGGVGYDWRKNNLCNCVGSTFAMDFFARSFAPELAHYSVAVLDANGNLILRVGRYGNVDDGMPLMKDGGPPNPRSIGGDEVGLFYPFCIATHTDRRLFVADPGNARIVGVRLDYHATAQVPLRDVPDANKPVFTAESAEDAKNERE